MTTALDMTLTGVRQQYASGTTPFELKALLRQRSESAFVVQPLLATGALPLGKAQS